MARYIVRHSYVNILGELWMPNCVVSLHVTLRDYDIENMRTDGPITREDVNQWLTSHSGDFQRVIDFQASIEDGDRTIDIPWSSEDTELAYLDTLGDME